MKVAASLHERVLAAASAASKQLDAQDATVAIILGSGLASAAERLHDARATSYAALPCFPEPTVAGHPGRLLCGRFGPTKVLIFCGRVHLYEGYSAAEVAIPVRMAATLGVQTLVVTNVAGNVSLQLQLSGKPGQYVLVFGARPQNPGVTYVDHYPFLGVLPEEAGETADINALYAARFGLPPAGKRVFIRTVQQINGWQDRPQTFSARVPPA